VLFFFFLPLRAKTVIPFLCPFFFSLPVLVPSFQSPGLFASVFRLNGSIPLAFLPVQCRFSFLCYWTGTRGPALLFLSLPPNPLGLDSKCSPLSSPFLFPLFFHLLPLWAPGCFPRTSVKFDGALHDGPRFSALFF